MKANVFLFLFGCTVYPTVEMLWRSHTHVSMALAGGVCMVLIHWICGITLKNKSLPLRCAAGSAIITLVELIFGVFVNLILHLRVWDYSNVPMNFMGQICLPFSLVWFFLTMPACAFCKLSNRIAAQIQLPSSGALQIFDVFFENR